MRTVLQGISEAYRSSTTRINSLTYLDGAVTPAEVGIVMLFGMVPGILQFATEQLFVDPQILEVTLGRINGIECKTDRWIIQSKRNQEVEGRLD